MAEENKMLVEREYIIPLRREWLKAPRYKRVPKAVKAIRKFIARHMKVPEKDERRVKISRWVNHELWFRGIRKPPAHIRVKARKFVDYVDVELVEIPDKIKWMIASEEKRFAPAPKKAEKKEEKVEEKKKIEKGELEKKTENGEEKVEERKEKVEATIESGMKHAKEEAKQHRHESKHEKVVPHRMALKK